jgi:hypothetical protein
MKKIAIFCTEYMDNSGGIVVMHYLCHLLRSLDVQAYMFPRFSNFLINFFLNNNYEYEKILASEFIRTQQLFKNRKYFTNTNFDTPVMFESPQNGFDNDWIVIYPENTIGNPLGAKNIVRWLLAPPLQHSDLFTVNRNEYIVSYGPVCGNVYMRDVTAAARDLHIQYVMTDVYFRHNFNLNREGVAYCIRKGKHNLVKYKLENAICIDGLSHHEIAKIFNKVDVFVSYDNATFYSQYAVLCGAKSVVIDDYFTTDQWRKIPDKYGIALGFDEIEWAIETAPMLENYFKEKNKLNIQNCTDFINDINQYFI